MKKITLLAALFWISLSHAQDTTPGETFKGESLSERIGLLAKIGGAIGDPAALSRAPLYRTPFYGSRKQPAAQGSDRSATADYGFNSSDYQGVNVPLQSVFDASGNTYTTGVSSDPDDPKGHFTLVKTDASGVQEWAYLKPVPDFAVEYGTAIAMGADGNPVAAGMHWNGHDMDVHTAKVDAATGAVIWQANFNGGVNGVDVASAVTVDDSGNTIVAGITYTGTSMRYLVLKYDASGVLQWSFTDDNPVDNVWNEPTAVTTDASGNIAVTGFGSTEDYFQTYYTIKLSAGGDKLWGADYAYQALSDPEDPGSPLVNANAVANDVKFDAQGNCYVTGILNTGFGTMGTLKYDASGNQQWVMMHKSGSDHTTAHQLEISGDTVYISGRHMGDWFEDGLVLISYDTGGTENWVKETTNLADAKIPRMTLDGSGRAVISGYGYDDNGNTLFSTLRYEQDGTLETEADYLIEASALESLGGLVGLGLDGNGNFVLSLAYTYTELGNVFRTVQMPLAEGAQEPAWNVNYSGGSRNNKRLLSSAAGQDGSVYITGSFGQIEGESYVVNYYLEKYDANGSVAWQKVFNPANGNDVNGIQLQVAPDGNPLVYLVPYGFGDPLRLKKYDASGAVVWEYETTVFTPSFNAFFTDAAGNAYLSGASRIAETDESPVFTTIKVSASGTGQWVAHTPSNNAGDTIFEIASGTTDADGNVIVAGAVGSGGFFSQDVSAALLKYSPDGALQWFSAEPVPGNNSAFSGIFAQAGGSIVANGAWSDQDTGQERMMLRKYDASGVQQWESVVEENGRNVRSYKTLEMSGGDLVTAAFSVIYGVNNKVVVTRFDAQGNQVSSEETALDHFYRDITTDGEYVFLLTQFYGTTMPNRLFYSAGPFYAGKVTKIDSGGMADESLVGPELSPYDPGNFVVSGESLLIPGTLESEATVFQGVYFFESDFDMLGVEHPDPPAAPHDWLGQNYPNPARGNFTIPVDLAQAGELAICLYDATGRLISQLFKGTLDAGRTEIPYSAGGLSSGIYFYQAKAANGVTASRKLVVE